MKKTVLFLTAIFMAFILAACGGTAGTSETGSDNKNAEEQDGKISIIATIFPEYDWTREILGSNPGGADLSLLLDSGVDLHSFQPTAEDILNIANCDLFIYVGGESDQWVEDTLTQSPNENRKVINLLEVLGDQAKEEEQIEGMQEEEHEHEGEEEEGPEYDEHVWLSLKNAETLCNAIADALAEIDPDNAETYKQNAAAYSGKLKELDASYEETAAQAGTKTLLFGDRFPFRYLTDDYGLDYYAAFAGCSAETEASFETVLFLAQKTDELNLSHIMTIEGTDHSIAETIIENTQTKDQDILTLDSMQSVTAKNVEEGVTYLSIMDGNLKVLSEALK